MSNADQLTPLGAFSGKRRKYRNTPTMVGMFRFDSKAEAKRFCDLRILAQAGEITDLKRQVPFKLYGRGGAHVCLLRVDFTYRENGRHIAEDFKGFETKDFKIKAKLFRDNYPEIELRITR